MHREQSQPETAPEWQIYLFGRLEIRRPDGSIFSCDGKKVGALLACLALAPERAHTRAALAHLLWPESDPVNSRTRLRQEIAALRALLQGHDDAASPLHISRNDVQLRGEHVWTDAARFGALLREAGTPALSERSGAEADAHRERLLDEAVGLYRADLLTEYGEFTAERLACAQLYEKACRELAALQSRCGAYKRAEETLKRLLAQDPLLEEAHVELMRLYAAINQPARVRRQYQELEQVLRQQLNALPAAATTALLATLLQAPAATPKPLDPDVQSSLPDTHDQPSVSTVPPAAPLPAPATAEQAADPAKPSLAPPPSAHTGATRPLRSTLRPVPRLRRRVAAFVLSAALLCMGLMVVNWRSRRPRPIAPPQSVVRYGQEKWHYFYGAGAGEETDSEASAITWGLNGALYVTGWIKTRTEDTDILTVKLSPEGEPLWVGRYSGAGQDCDRAFSIAADGAGGVYVAGESYVPARPGQREGWHLVVLHYTADGNRDAHGNARPTWVRSSACVTENHERVRVSGDGQGGAYVAGTALVHGKPRMVFIHYAADGKPEWERLFPAGDGAATHFNDLLVTQEGVFACGTAQHSMEWDGAHQVAVVLHLAPDGTPGWQDSFGGPRNNASADFIGTCAVDALYVGGTFGMGDPGTGGTGVNPAVTRYTLGGKREWTSYAPDIGPDFPLTNFQLKGMHGTRYGVTLAGNVLAANGDLSTVLLNYDPYGNRRWARRYLPTVNRR